MKKPSEEDLEAVRCSNLETVQDLLTVVDAETVYKLLYYYSGLTLQIPKLESVLRYSRNKKIFKDYHQGLSLKQLSKKYNLTYQGIKWILKGRQKKNE